MLRQAAIAVPLALVALATPARAEVSQCAQADTDLDYAGSDIPEFKGDTGWFPGGFVAQLRLQARVLGHTNVSSGYTAKGCWTEGMQASVAGRNGSGYFDVAYGADLTLSGRLHASILGQSLNWEGNIPIPYVPQDMLIAGTQTFDPHIATTVAATVSDTTSPVQVISTDIIGQFITIGGISGGLYVTVQGGMTTTFRPGKTTLFGSTVTSFMDQVAVETPATGFHSTLDVPLAVDGIVKYAPKLIFAAGLDIKFLGIQVVKWQIGSITMGLPSFERTLKLTGEPATLLLAEMDGIGENARMDFSSASTQVLPVKNLGEAALAIEAVGAPAGVTVAPVSVSPGEVSELRVTVADGALAAGPVMLSLKTNDPDRPTVAVELGVQNGGTDSGKDDSEEPVGEASGCSTGSGQGAGVLLFALGFVVMRRRRR